MANKRLVCVLTTTGQLDMYNASNVEDVFNRANNFHEVLAPPIDDEWPMILPNQWARFPGNVHQIGNMYNADVTILADNVKGVRTSEDLDDSVPRAFVLADTVSDQTVNIMNLQFKQVQGIDESLKLVSPMGFAVGASTNKIYAWGISYELPPNQADPEEEEQQEDAQPERLDGVDEESKVNVAQLVRDPNLAITRAFPVPYKFDVDLSIDIVDVKSTMMQTCFLTTQGAVYQIDHKNGFTPAEFSVKESFLKNGIVQLESALGHFLALKKKIRPSIKGWDTRHLE